MKLFWNILLSLAILLPASAPVAFAKDAARGKVKKIIYRSHTEVNLTGETVKGAIREPEVFYIFQRKRVEDKRVVKPLSTLSSHDEPMRASLKGALPQ